mmetsp:Transcript_13759/g.30305  ORF Transcript_13759/g.30305 Transcript_13759/m.30305 type:complete len:91 (-) Transcript_13759:398-670(-)
MCFGSIMVLDSQYEGDVVKVVQNSDAAVCRPSGLRRCGKVHDFSMWQACETDEINGIFSIKKTLSRESMSTVCSDTEIEVGRTSLKVTAV